MYILNCSVSGIHISGSYCVLCLDQSRDLKVGWAAGFLIWGLADVQCGGKWCQGSNLTMVNNQSRDVNSDKITSIYSFFKSFLK